jgi:hypothetical protein
MAVQRSTRLRASLVLLAAVGLGAVVAGVSVAPPAVAAPNLLGSPVELSGPGSVAGVSCRPMAYRRPHLRIDRSNLPKAPSVLA